MAKKKKRSYQQLSFSRTQTKADILARDQARSHRVVRLLTTTLFAIAVSLLIGFDRFSFTSTRDLHRWAAVLGAVLLVCAAMLLLVRVYHRQILDNARSFTRFFLLNCLFLALCKALLTAPISPLLMPLPVLAMTLALVYTGPLAIHTALAAAVLVALMVEPVGTGGIAHGIGLVTPLFLGSIVAVLGVRRIRNRTRLVTVGLASGAIQFAAIAIISLWRPDLPVMRGLSDIGRFFIAPGLGFLNGLGSGILITSALPFIERIFDVTTDLRLIELADQNHPLLRQFSLLAPGSFMHSLMVGQLAEEAAQSIGANDLLARVGAYYHDIGKMLKPNYFVENMQQGENIHDQLSPEMSRLIIISHVKDGIRIAQEEKLPKPIIDMIPMHHGTSVVEYFYHKKRQQEEERGGISESGQEAFQYPGPKPTFREAGILMLADSTEAVSRVLSDPTPGRLRAVVKEIIRKKMMTGQLDECELTMRDLSRIEDAIVRVLTSIHHGRIRYPSDESGGGATGGAQQPPTGGGSPQSGERDRSDNEKGDRPPQGRKGSEPTEGPDSDTPEGDQQENKVGKRTSVEPSKR